MKSHSHRLSSVLAAAIGLLLVVPAHAIPTITRDEIISIAKSGVGCPYVWGGTCWDPNNKKWKGADCSGYVTKCWQIPTATKTTDCVPHYYTTSTFQNSSTHWSSISRNDLLKGDALVYNSGSAGHIILYYSGDKWGNAQVYEARGSAYGIIYRTKYVDSSYKARRRHSIVKPVPTYPQMSIKSSIVTIEGQDRDFCTDNGSAKIFDWLAGQTTKVHVDIKNSGNAVAKNVYIGLWAEEPYLKVTTWNIYSNWKQSGSFALNDTDAMQTIAHDSPGKKFSLWLGSISPGETKRIKLKVEALQYSIGAADHPDVRAWVSHVDNYYEKKDFGSSFNNVSNYQKQNGGDLRTYTETDVLEKELCDQKDNDCDGEVDEENVCGLPDTDGGIEPDDTDGPVPLPETDGLVPEIEEPSYRRRYEDGCDCATGRDTGSPTAASGLLLLALLAGLWLDRRGRRR